MSEAHRDHEVVCDVCGETFFCDEGFSCPSRMCDSCGDKMNELQRPGI